jgi:hypothetical protein
MSRVRGDADGDAIEGCRVRLRRSMRWLGHPLVTMVLGLLFVVDVLSLPAGWAEGGHSAVGTLINRDLLGRRSSVRAMPWGGIIDGYFVVDGDGVRAIYPDEDSWDETSRRLSERPGSVLCLQYQGVRSRYGLWAITWERTSERIALSFGSDLSPVQVAAARQSFAQRVSGTNAAQLAKDDVLDIAPRWFGFAHNAVSIGVFAVLVRSCILLPAWGRTRRARVAFERGQCPRCGYSIAGLARGDCPECGEPWTPAKEKDPGAVPGS